MHVAIASYTTNPGFNSKDTKRQMRENGARTIKTIALKRRNYNCPSCFFLVKETVISEWFLGASEKVSPYRRALSIFSLLNASFK